MSGTNHHTWHRIRVGQLLLTVELDPVADSHLFQRHKELARAASGLIDLMDAHRLPATWAVSDPAHSAATSQILRSPIAHELAILGDANWLGPAAGRTRFARELSRRVAQARGAGLHVSSLVPRAASVERHIDLVVKQQLTAIAGIEAQQHTSRQTTTPRPLHYGVWELPIGGKMPAKLHWILSSGWLTWRQIRRAAKDSAAFHLIIDAPAICDEGQRAQQSIELLVRRIANLRDRGLIHVETMRAASERLSDVPPIKPQQSILRRAG